MTLLRGANPSRYQRIQTLLVAVGLFSCSAVFFTVVSRVDLLVEIIRWEFLAVGLLALSALIAVRDGGLRRTWLFAFALEAGFGIHLGGVGITGKPPGPLFRVVWAGVVGLIAALILGTLGGSLGLGVKRLSTS
ncbi:hypothetical protein E6P09_15300 (plasmid) [Haloferax mediterranei ATCC 33500]|uniref:Uncharacterized protein n=1 Tax=Haloferax mediterranei (strain ATCC 33500 / DSM 1411 / JCM 8866 / NBRC 14739 / NCIMB 2177 / R-4) TaxID=523841 RepID=M0INU7_HALMT|nr:hypothetical protein [Haloferax mediterranei]AHZ24705.1 hypothetical protein BM92_17665 [Haloferax mediterranei ATCC 33500]ELZ97488.1 hypothetical protein C439_19238 [Haloferax mediterranei ATCC 33500]MDX5990220.1 hypothetical protein [Haloferax mediterranei ATCC 33500]QCQ76710.1 hypothetical protein E6P09_15300 [Haloferax mediterranei ATCC 33500]